jgi:hypothetical protein
MLSFAGYDSVNIITWAGGKGKGGRGSVEAAEDAEGAVNGLGNGLNGVGEWRGEKGEWRIENGEWRGEMADEVMQADGKRGKVLKAY